MRNPEGVENEGGEVDLVEDYELVNEVEL